MARVELSVTILVDGVPVAETPWTAAFDTALATPFQNDVIDYQGTLNPVGPGHELDVLGRLNTTGRLKATVLACNATIGGGGFYGIGFNNSDITLLDADALIALAHWSSVKVESIGVPIGIVTDGATVSLVGFVAGDIET